MGTMPLPDPDSTLDRLHVKIYDELVHRLNSDNAWRQMAAIIPIFNASDIRKFECSTSPSRQLLIELESRLCTIGSLCEILSQCYLLDALALIAPPQPVVIEQHPGQEPDTDEFVAYGGQLQLKVVASGIPPPQYVWFYENEELSDQTSSVLLIDNFTEENEGEYRCLVSQPDYEIFSSTVNVRILPQPLCIVEQPVPVSCHTGEQIILTCSCEGYPAPEFQWFHGNMLLEEQDSNTLIVNCATLDDQGMYFCYISNEFQEIYTEKVDVTVYASSSTNSVSKEDQKILTVSEKVALLIANDSYDNMESLKTPANDVATLAEILTSLGFKVLALYNLTLNEMRNAMHKLCEMLPENAYVIFYFAGHGFELHNKYMLPVDVPREYLHAHILCEKEVIKEILNKSPKLLLIILDMCLRVPDRKDNPVIYEEAAHSFSFNPNRNLIQAYATTSNLGAYERKTEENGIYVKHLKKFLQTGHPIMKILDLVNESISSEETQVASKQMPSYTSNVIADLHYLTHPAEGSEEMEAIFASYNTAHPPIDVCFRHLKCTATFHLHQNCFQNIMDIRIKDMPHCGMCCTLPCQELYVKMKRDGSDVIVTIYNLQKLKMQLTLTIMLFIDDPKTGKRVLVDNTFIELKKKPLIVSAELWFDRPAILDSQK